VSAWLFCIGLAVAGCDRGGEGALGPSANQAPQIRSITVTPAVIPLGGTALVQVDAIDPDGDRLFYRYSAEAGTIIADPAHEGQATYTRIATELPGDTITVTATDTKNASNSAARTVPFLGNRPPQVSIGGGGSCHPPCTRTFTASATDPDGDPVTYLWTGCASGTANIATCSLATVGDITAAVVVSDGRGGVASASALATGTNRPPVIMGGGDIVARAARFNVFYDDPDGDALACGWVGYCQCTGSIQSFNLDCVLPPGLSACVEHFSCTDPFGATTETMFRLVP
jgi:hypothetical protein